MLSNATIGDYRWGRSYLQGPIRHPPPLPHTSLHTPPSTSFLPSFLASPSSSAPLSSPSHNPTQKISLSLSLTLFLSLALSSFRLHFLAFAKEFIFPDALLPQRGGHSPRQASGSSSSHAVVCSFFFLFSLSLSYPFASSPWLESRLVNLCLSHHSPALCPVPVGVSVSMILAPPFLSHPLPPLPSLTIFQPLPSFPRPLMAVVSLNGIF